jgi:hypothetical protein
LPLGTSFFEARRLKGVVRKRGSYRESLEIRFGDVLLYSLGFVLTTDSLHFVFCNLFF